MYSIEIRKSRACMPYPRWAASPAPTVDALIEGRYPVGVAAFFVEEEIFFGATAMSGAGLFGPLNCGHGESKSKHAKDAVHGLNGAEAGATFYVLNSTKRYA